MAVLLRILRSSRGIRARDKSVPALAGNRRRQVKDSRGPVLSQNLGALSFAGDFRARGPDPDGAEISSDRLHHNDISGGSEKKVEEELLAIRAPCLL